jgi:hypothetical protein
VLVEVKKVMAIESIPIIVMSDDDDMELSVELAMDIADVVVADPVIDIVMPDIDMLSISIL